MKLKDFMQYVDNPTLNDIAIKAANKQMWQFLKQQYDKQRKERMKKLYQIK